MQLFSSETPQFQIFLDDVGTIISRLSEKAKPEDIHSLEKLIADFKLKTEDFYREDRKLNIGVIGQVKAGKSSFLNTLLFEGKEILPKASTPKTATLTKMEYSDRNIIEIEYYSEEEWALMEENASVDLEDEIYSSAKELVKMARENGIDPHRYLQKGKEQSEFASYEELVEHLNDYVGEDGKYTPIVKSVTLYLHKEEFQGLSIVDTPGLNDPIVSRTIRTRDFMKVCDVVFFLSQSGSFLDKSDWELLASQLPQEGTKRLVLIASKFDSGIRDVLREQDPDDIFGEDENTADTIPKACKIIRKKLRKRARGKVEEFVQDLERRGSSPDLIGVIRQCTTPIMVSAMAYNMSQKPEAEYSREERNVYAALKQFSDDMQEDLKLLGNFDEVNSVFSEVAEEKENILEKKARDFVPDAREKLRDSLEKMKEKAGKRLAVLEGNDREQLLEQKNAIAEQMGGIKAGLAEAIGDLNIRLESEKATGIRELREASKDYSETKERIGSITRTSSYTTGHLWWKKTHYYTYEQHYSYCLAADAIENLRKYSAEAVNQVEEVFSEALQLKEIKRKLLNIIINNFDMGSETYDSSLFRIMVEETVSTIEFPVFRLDISDAMEGIAAKFSGELTSASQKTELSIALQHGITRIYEELCESLNEAVREYKGKLSALGKQVEDKLLENINQEFAELVAQCENKEQEIAEYRAYGLLLEQELARLS